MDRSPVSPAAPSPGLTHYCFTFISVFAEEGGIQSYVQDILSAYHQWCVEQDITPPTQILILRDRGNEAHPFRAVPHWRFQGYKARSVHWERLRLTLALLSQVGANWLRRQPQRVICGHVNLLPLVAPLCQALGVPYVVLTYGKEVWTTLPPKVGQALRGADRWVAISRYSRDRAAEQNRLDRQKALLLPCVVDGDRFCPGPPSPDLQQHYGLQNHKVLLTVARLWSGDIYKGVDVTLRALPQILAQEPTVKYLVIGRGDDQPRLAQLAQTLGIADRVVFAGFVPTAELVQHYRLADVYVMPSQEGFGIVYLEALACGVPVIAGDSDGSADPLQDGRVGWRVPHRDPQAVAQACLEVLAGNDRRCDRPWLRQETLAHFSHSSMVKALKPVLHRSNP